MPWGSARFLNLRKIPRISIVNLCIFSKIWEGQNECKDVGLDIFWLLIMYSIQAVVVVADDLEGGIPDLEFVFVSAPKWPNKQVSLWILCTHLYSSFYKLRFWEILFTNVYLSDYRAVSSYTLIKIVNRVQATRKPNVRVLQLVIAIVV